jgi:acyl-CoA synthetase (AMP-forming)/AMP-acid ligase II
MWNFDKFRDNIAIINENGETTTYAELQSKCEILFSQLKHRSLVFHLCTNEKGSLLGYVAFINNDIIPAMFDAALDKGLLSALIENYKPDYLWLPQHMAGEFSVYSGVCSVWGYTLLKTPYDRAYPLHDELALLLTTSGSTGSSKLVRLSYANMRANTESIVDFLRLDATERPITTMPMSYTYGLSIINSHLWVGASIILTQKTLMEKAFWQQIRDYGATSFGGVPYIYEMLEKLRFFRMELPLLRTMTQAGGKLSPELHRKFAEYAEEKGKKFIVMYGQTEATARMSYLPAEKSLEKCASMGIAIPGGEFSLMDDDGNEITAPEVVGELCFRGANVTLGYAISGTDLIKGDERGGVLLTGDMAKRDSDGFYYIVGRKNRFLKIFGSRVNLDETDRLLRDEFQGFECVCSGIDDKMTVFITDGKSADSVIKFLAEKTGLNRVAFKTILVDSIPRTGAGKILYNALNGN